MPRYIFYVVNILVNIILYLLHKTHYIHLRRAFCGFKVRVEDLSEVQELVGSELARKPDQLSEKSVFTSIFTHFIRKSQCLLVYLLYNTHYIEDF